MAGARQRLLFLVFGLSACLIALELRLFHLQVIRHPDAAEQVTRRHHRQESDLGVRGRVLTANGYVLAESVPALDVYANSQWTRGHRETIATHLERLLAGGISSDEIRERLDRTGYVRIMRRPLDDVAPLVELTRLKRRGELPGIELEKTFVRRYPEGPLAAHVVGYVDRDGEGRAGVELELDDVLKGVPGVRRLAQDAARRPMFDLDCELVPQTPGRDVVLTVDVVLQYFAEEAIDTLVQEHRPAWASIVVVEPATGKVRALANRPNYDPNRYGAFPVAHHLNPAISSQYTPGSTFKPFMMGAVLDAAAADLTETIDCSRFDELGRRLSDSHQNGVLTPTAIMVESSNIGMAKLALRLVPGDDHPRDVRLAGFRRLRGFFSDLGFGRATDVGLPAEGAGHLRPLRNWTRKYTLVSMAFGHEVSVTPVQLASAFAVFATGGVHQPPRIVEAIVDGSGAAANVAPEPKQILDERTADDVREMLVRVVDEGTGEECRIDGYSVAGKTSTAQWERDPTKYTASFVGFAPAYDPRLLVLVVVDRPAGSLHSGGKVAAPAAREILERGLAYLRVPHDRMDGAR